MKHIFHIYLHICHLPCSPLFIDPNFYGYPFPFTSRTSFKISFNAGPWWWGLFTFNHMQKRLSFAFIFGRCLPWLYKAGLTHNPLATLKMLLLCLLAPVPRGERSSVILPLCAKLTCPFCSFPGYLKIFSFYTYLGKFDIKVWVPFFLMFTLIEVWWEAGVSGFIV